MKKRTLALIYILTTGSIVAAATRSGRTEEATDRCSNCNKTKDDDHTGKLMASNAFNIIINGFIAAQSGNNSERQTQAVVNALSCVSNLFQLALRRTDCTPKDAEQLAHEIAIMLHNPEMIQMVTRHLTDKKMATIR